VPDAPSAVEYDYERLLDLTAQIGNCAHKIERGLPERTGDGNVRALQLSWQIEEDVKELRRILAARQRAIEEGR
jgi:hypothetical protein